MRSFSRKFGGMGSKGRRRRRLYLEFLERRDNPSSVLPVQLGLPDGFDGATFGHISGFEDGANGEVLGGLVVDGVTHPASVTFGVGRTPYSSSVFVELTELPLAAGFGQDDSAMVTTQSVDGYFGWVDRKDHPYRQPYATDGQTAPTVPGNGWYIASAAQYKLGAALIASAQPMVFYVVESEGMSWLVPVDGTIMDMDSGVDGALLLTGKFDTQAGWGAGLTVADPISGEIQDLMVRDSSGGLVKGTYAGNQTSGIVTGMYENGRKVSYLVEANAAGELVLGQNLGTDVAGYIHDPVQQGVTLVNSPEAAVYVPTSPESPIGAALAGEFGTDVVVPLAQFAQGSSSIYVVAAASTEDAVLCLVRRGHPVTGSLEVVALVNVEGSNWQNPSNRFDVTASGGVTPLDALTLINEINQGKDGRLERRDVPKAPFVDTNGDGLLTAGDVVVVVNYLNTAAAEAAGEFVQTTFAPEIKPPSPEVVDGVLEGTEYNWVGAIPAPAKSDSPKADFKVAVTSDQDEIFGEGDWLDTLELHLDAI